MILVSFMSSDAIYLVSDSGELQRVEHQLYASEVVLQELVAKHPELLAGDQIDPQAPPKWLLLRREAAIPDSADGADRWWLDHLLLDQFGVPTLLEVKRSTDTRIRREVIGQMLDYVANAQAYWVAGRMRQMLTDESGSPELADSKLAELLGLSDEPEALPDQIQRFWQTVETNLREGNVRLLFVADELPRELRRLIEFLNAQFSTIEVLGVELRQYVGQGVKALVPRVIGLTEAARERKERTSSSGAPAKGATTRETFLALAPADTRALLSTILDGAAQTGYEVKWGTKGFSLRLALAEGKKSVFYGYPPGVMGGGVAPSVEAYTGYLRDPAAKEQLAALFLRVPGFTRVSDLTIRCILSNGASVDADAVAKALETASRELLIPR